MKTQVKSLKVPYNTPKHKKSLVTETVDGKELLTQIYDSYQAEPLAEQRKLLYRALHLIKLNPENIDWFHYRKYAEKIYPEYNWGMLSFYLVRLPNSESVLTDLFIQFIEECFARLKNPVTE